MTSSPDTQTHILVATDFSTNSFIALQKGAEIARKLNGRVTLLYSLHPVPSVPPLGVSDQGPFDPSLSREQLEAAEQSLLKLKNQYFAGIEHVEVAAVEGPSASAEICEYARKHGVDWIVVGTQGRTGIGHMLIGSVAERVVRHAPCTVVVARPHDAKS